RFFGRNPRFLAVNVCPGEGLVSPSVGKNHQVLAWRMSAGRLGSLGRRTSQAVPADASGLGEEVALAAALTAVGAGQIHQLAADHEHDAGAGGEEQPAAEAGIL